MIDIEKMTVLIVDDMEPMCRSIRGMMKVLNFGKYFHFAGNGAEAWNILKKEEINMAIIDWNMPVMTGVELLGMVREDDKLRDLPVVMVTAEANREIVAEAGESEIDAYILKPLTVKSLGNKIALVVEKFNNPPPMIAHLKRARVLFEKGKTDAAVKECINAINTEPSSSRPYRELGIIYFKSGDNDNAEKFLIRAAKMNKVDVFAFHYLGEVYVKKNDLDKASKYYEKAMRISPRHISRGLEFGKILLEKKMYDMAQNVFDKVISLSEKPIQLQIEISDICLENKNYAYAAKTLGYVIKADPKRYDSHFKRGIAVEMMGDYLSAIPYFIEAEKLNKENIAPKLHIAKCYVEAKQIFRAEQFLNEVLKLEPENESARELLKRCI
ncbi:MAG: tetratricopeptide repeat protein [Desulfobacterales bacterium]|nr:tetratricopeptide repeat protein [Desulfobacterales bacterium]